MNRCPDCPAKNTCIGPDGPEDADYLFIGEAPGRDEDRQGRVFVGKTGEEVNHHYLPLSGLNRQRVRIINSIACLPDRYKGKLDLKKKADVQLLESCAGHHLYPEIRRKHYKLIVPMGAFACYAIDPSINLELQHGFPVATRFGLAFPMYHPAGGIHEPKKMLLIRNDWDRLRRYIRGTLKLPFDEFDGDEQYADISEPSDIDALLGGMWKMPLACDTESTRRKKPFCLTFSVEPGTGYMIRADNQRCLQAFQSHLDRWRGPILFHHWLYDAQVVAQMGLRFPNKLIKDTMALAFHLGNLPQGLKALAFRELAMKMQDFDDLVTPYALPKVLSYYREALLQEWPKPAKTTTIEADGSEKEHQPQAMSTKIKRFLTAYGKDSTQDPFEAWKNWDNSWEEIESKCGEYPGKCITYAPFEKVIHYACRDADATLRLYSVLKAMRKLVRRKPQECWRGDR